MGSRALLLSTVYYSWNCNVINFRVLTGENQSDSSAQLRDPSGRNQTSSPSAHPQSSSVDKPTDNEAVDSGGTQGAEGTSGEEEGEEPTCPVQ